MRDLIRTIKYATRFKGLTGVVFVFSLAQTGISLIQPFIMKLFFDLVETNYKTGVSPAIMSEYFRYTLIYLGFSLFSILINRTNEFYWTKLSNKTEESLNNEAFEHVQNLSLDFYAKNQTGKITERIGKGIWDAISVMQNFVFEFFPQLLLFLTTTIILFTVNVLFALIVGFGIPTYFLITWYFNRKLRKLHDAIRNDYENMSNTRTETIVNIRTVKSYAQEVSQLKKMKANMKSKVDHNMQWVKIANTMYLFRSLTFYGSQFAALSLGIYMILMGQITLGTFVLVWQYVSRAYQPMNYIMRLYDNTVRAMASVKRLFDTLDEVPTVRDVEGAKNLRVKNGEITIKDLHFEYSDGDGKKILRGIDLTIPAKKTVAIVGKSGSGKTTLAKLLMRFHDTTRGEIQIDGIDIKTVTQRSLRQNIGYVLQDSLLFNDTASNNIRFGNSNAKEAEVVNAAKLANAHDFILRLPKGYKTEVGERGVKLSGGEQQRINIARAVLKNAPILILDEATSSLDSESEGVIQDALFKLIKDKTTIIIAHRLSTVMKADIIIVMDKGRIVETGTHQDLVSKRGIYAKLFEIQSGGYLDTIEPELMEIANEAI
jgi:ABC-type multidrug transport system fused ATPase/permease subunit